MDEAIDQVTVALKERGFGILTEIDIQATLKGKLDVDFRPYKILGACNPPYAYQALQSESNIALMLPCNVIVQEAAPGRVEVAAIDPISSMQAIENPALGEVAQEVQSLLRETILSL